MAGGIVTVERSGGRTIELLIPYEFQGNKYEAIHIAPCTLDHSMRWKKGAFEDWFALLVELARDAKTGKPMRADDLRQMRYPDADRVIGHFTEMLPDEVRRAVMGNFWPVLDAAGPPADTAAPSQIDDWGAEPGDLQPDDGMNIGDE